MNVTDTELTHAEILAGMERPPRPEKVAEVERLQAILKGSAAVYLTDYRGINVEMMNDLRRRFREAGVEFTIVKNSLLKRAADSAELPAWIADMEGPTALAIGVEDPVAPARVIREFQEEFKRQAEFLVFKAGLLEGEAIEADTFQKLATLPGREELIAKLLYMLTWPLRGLVTALSGLPRNLVFALEDLRKKRAEDEPAAEPAAEAEADVTDQAAAEAAEPAAEAEGESGAEAGEAAAEAEGETVAASEDPTEDSQDGSGSDEPAAEGEAGDADAPDNEETTE
jgi:large subunit ribosomal protein L10